MTKLLIGLMMAGALLVGCDKGGEGGAKTEGTGKAASASGSGDSIGVAECDEYFKKVEECFGKNPAVKAAMADSVKQNKAAWKQAAATPAGKEGLKTSCKMAVDALAQSCK
ncbi:MAG TPA: hypothetical protein VHB21_06895 [Minicystis sp.]|nr:hypothetical protein [Minicystis sp.]